jgi:hypothetical protein
MVVAWLFLACTGTMTARYGKKINKKVLGKDIWFRIHQVIQTFNNQKLRKKINKKVLVNTFGSGFIRLLNF